MGILIVENSASLGAIWQAHLERQGMNVTLVTSETKAIATIRFARPELIILNLNFVGDSALAIADFAAYQVPDTRIIFVNRDSFFSDGSVFIHAPNACACIPEAVLPDDLCALAAHYGLPALA